MPLYQHKSGERVRTVAGSREDRRLRASADWREDAGEHEHEQLDGDAGEPEPPNGSDETWQAAPQD